MLDQLITLLSLFINFMYILGIKSYRFRSVILALQPEVDSSFELFALSPPHVKALFSR